MYQGDANVNEQNLPSFLEIAEDLNVRGFYERNTDGFKSDRGKLHKSPIHLQRKKISMTKSRILLATIITLMILILKN